MAAAQLGDTVRVHYTGKLKDGTVFDSSEGASPLEFTLGQGQLIPGFEQGVIGMEPGDTRTLSIPADQAYGPHRPEGIIDVNRTELPPNLPLEVGMQLQATQEGGQVVNLTVTEIGDETVKMDGNHPLAGKDLTFDIQLMEID
jgi:FKBP-type peptidyl-prolyl cis-trans isomerase 2